jgi:hypothetical protein
MTLRNLPSLPIIMPFIMPSRYLALFKELASLKEPTISLLLTLQQHLLVLKQLSFALPSLLIRLG